MLHSHIHVFRVLGTYLNSREEAQALFVYVEAEMKSISEVKFDFTGVEFMSRSFADEFYKLKISFCKDYSVSVYCANTIEQIDLILKAVASTQGSRLRTPIVPKELFFKDHSSFNDYMMALA